MRWRPRGVHPGGHAGAGEGGEGAFRRHAELLRSPDPRRLDVLASLRDPFGGLHVRQFSPRRAITVAALVDTSGSMGFNATLPGPAAELCALLADAAQAMGDSFALLAAGPAARPELDLPPTRRRGLGAEVLRRLRGAPAAGTGSDGLAEAAGRLPARRSLVFLISDFLMPEEAVERVLAALWRHEVVPVVLRDSATQAGLPRWGLVDLADLETGRSRLVLLRPALRARWQRAAAERRAALEARFRRHGARPFELVDRFDPEAFARHLLGG
ncbi:hypothetical protein KHC27_07940 [Ancylobacter lacus]|nr:hypothetical protein [Ancylobacter lacus]